jgi:hypothetical protein
LTLASKASNYFKDENDRTSDEGVASFFNRTLPYTFKGFNGSEQSSGLLSEAFVNKKS